MTRIIYIMYAFVATSSATWAYMTETDNYIIYGLMAAIIVGILSTYKPNPKNVLDRVEISLVAFLSVALLLRGISSMIVGMTGNDYMDLLSAINTIIFISVADQYLD